MSGPLGWRWVSGSKRPAHGLGREGERCAWCLTHALDAGLGQPLAYQLPVPEPPRAALPTATLTFSAQPLRWPFAARDPPPAQRA